MQLRELGEFGLIRRLRALAERGQAGDQDLVLGIGDDAAAWRVDGRLEVGTTDTMVDGVHFLSDRMAWEAVGWKCMAANLSDVAAMGCYPRYALVTLGLPEHMPAPAPERVYEGLLSCSREHGGRIVGGDVVRSPVAFVSVALVGGSDGPLLRRDRARPGDGVAVTGSLGGPAGGAALVRGRVAVTGEPARRLLEAHEHPAPRLGAGQALAREGVLAAIDVSDGLVADLARLCEASGVAAAVRAEDVPVSPFLREAMPEQALGLALGGGEEYELLFAAPEPVLSRALAELPVRATRVGEIVPGEAGRVRVVDASGRDVPVPAGGWDHLSGAPA